MTHAQPQLPKRKSLVVVAQLAAPHLGTPCVLHLSTSLSSSASLPRQAKRGSRFALRVTAQFKSAAYLFALTCALPFSLLAQETNSPSRPKILEISSVQIDVTDYCKGIEFYSEVLGKANAGQSAACQGRCDLLGDIQTNCPEPNQTETHYGIGWALKSGQQIDLGSFGTPNPYKLISGFGFVTDDAPELFRYLESKGVDASYSDRYGTRVAVQDPEGHRIEFVDRKRMRSEDHSIASPGEPRRIIHVGFVVWNRENIDHFYKDILGFHVYWHGGMKEGEDKWVDMQVPDGTDWIEYMLNVPENATHKMNHIALGVPDIHAAQQQLIKNGWKGTEEPKIGRDGKWQLNLYDPDETRVEMMEFKPTKEPCCSPYTGPHPGPPQQ